MSKQHHTPGPWRYDDLFHTIRVEGQCDVIDCGVWSAIAEVKDTEQTDEDGRVWACQGTREANGQLMAAAPKMLAMLQEVIAPIPDGRSWAMVYAERNRKVREVIAEALGQPTQPSPEWLAKAAEAEDACPGGISVGGLAVDMGVYEAKGGEGASGEVAQP